LPWWAQQFSGALVMMLASQGKLSLSDTASKHLPFLDSHEPFTILELLNHTAGVNDGDYDTKGVDPRSQIEQAKRISERCVAPHPDLKSAFMGR
jgi:CubicO group peptidase (beta-lactamase class C family)